MEPGILSNWCQQMLSLSGWHNTDWDWHLTSYGGTWWQIIQHSGTISKPGMFPTVGAPTLEGGTGMRRPQDPSFQATFQLRRPTFSSPFPAPETLILAKTRSGDPCFKSKDSIFENLGGTYPPKKLSAPRVCSHNLITVYSLNLIANDSDIASYVMPQRIICLYLPCMPAK